MLTSVSICRNLLYYIAFGTKQSSVSNAQKHFKQAFFKNWDSLHAGLNSDYKAWSYKKKKHKKIKAYRKSV